MRGMGREYDWATVARVEELRCYTQESLEEANGRIDALVLSTIPQATFDLRVGGLYREIRRAHAAMTSMAKQWNGESAALAARIRYLEDHTLSGRARRLWAWIFPAKNPE